VLLCVAIITSLIGVFIQHYLAKHKKRKTETRQKKLIKQTIREEQGH
jgi:phosphotransferase system  glucose/maltose/N-acetylglucosamine-specific IIC component